MSNNSISSNNEKGSSRIPLFFAYIFAILLVILLVKTASGFEPITFTSLLEFLSSVKKVFVDFSIGDFTITADWGLFDGLRDFLNIPMSMIGIVVFVGKSLVNILWFFVQIIYFIF